MAQTPSPSSPLPDGLATSGVSDELAGPPSALVASRPEILGSAIPLGMPLGMPHSMPQETPADAEDDFFTPPRGTRQTFYQKLQFDGTWLAGGSSSGLGLSDLDAKLVVALPAPTRQWPMLITPGWSTHFLDAPGRDLPARLDDAYTEFRWLPRLSERLLLDLVVTPGVYRDFDHSTADGLRVTSHAAAVWAPNRRAKLVLGVAYLDRPDLNWLPIGGLLWTPNEQWQLDLLFPQPKIARRIDGLSHRSADAALDPEVEVWLYLAGEFGDWQWAIQRQDGQHDTITYRDCRLLLGLQRKAIGRLDSRIEVGYVFSRKLEYLSTSSESQPDGTLLLRAGLAY